MKNQTRSKNLPVIISISVVVALIAGYLLLKNYISLILLSLIAAYLFNPVYQWGLKKFKSEGKSVSFTVLVLFFVFTLPLIIVLAVTVNQTIEIVRLIQQSSLNSESFNETVVGVVDGLNRQIDRIPGLDNVDLSMEQIIDAAKNIGQNVLSVVINFLKSLAGGVAGFFTNLIIFLFLFSSLLKNQKKLIKGLQDINPLGSNASSIYLQKMGDMTTAMVKGQFAIAVCQALAGVLFLWIVGIDYLAFWFVLLTFLSIIPLGGGIVLIPLGIVMILMGNIWQGIFILATHFLITTNIDNILRPKFVPKNASLDPALTILSVFAGISLFGFMGIVIGPVLMIVIVTAISSYLQYKRTGEIYKDESTNDKSKKNKLKGLLAKTLGRKSTPSLKS